jgi:hypothetical protein
LQGCGAILLGCFGLSDAMLYNCTCAIITPSRFKLLP